MTLTYAGGYGDSIIDVSGAPLTSRAVSVCTVGTNTLVTLYTDATKATTAANPVTTDAAGNLKFYAAPGPYDLVAGVTRITVFIGADSRDVAAGGGGAPALIPTLVKTSAYTAVASDLVPVDTTSGAVTVTLPTAPPDGTRVSVKHVIQGATNAVTVACAGSDVFNKTAGATSAALPLLAQAIAFQYKASGAIWYVVGDDIPLPQLDLRYAPLLVTQTSQTASYTFVLADGNTIVEYNSSSAGTFTVPPNSSVAFPVCTVIAVRQYGAGLLTVAQGAGVTIDSRGAALKMGGQFAEATLTKRATNEWVLSGDIST